jgi:hypothetical protein
MPLTLIQKDIATAANLTSTLLQHYVGPRLEKILDSEAKVSHEAVSTQIESRIGSGEGPDAKGPDMRVWSKGKNLAEVRKHLLERFEGTLIALYSWTGNWWSSLTHLSSFPVPPKQAMT